MGMFSQALYAVFSIAVLSAPILVFIVWLIKVFPEEKSLHSWRTILLWAGLIAATLSIGFAWSGVVSHGNALEPSHLRLRIRGTFCLAVLALLCSLLGKGKGRWLVAPCSIISPFTWVMYFAWI